MRHPTDGALRRLLDEPAGVSDADRRHVSGCEQCLGGLVAIRADAGLVEAALRADGHGDVDVNVAWQRLSAASTVPARAHRSASRSGAVSKMLRRPAAAALAVGIVLTGAGAAAANDWLQIFRTNQLAPVSITTGDLVALPDLRAYGDLEVTSEPDVHQVATERVAAAQSGLDVPQVGDLPRGITGEPVYQVGGKATATFTFSADRAARAAAETGQTLPPLPPGLDGSQVRLAAGPGVAQVWSSSTGLPALIVGRAVAPTAFSSGARFEVVRDYLLSLPGLPDDVAEQLRAFTSDGSTLPLPVPADQVTTRSTEVDGRPATLLTSRDRTLAAVVWVAEGVVTVVGGALDDSEVLSVARELG